MPASIAVIAHFDGACEPSNPGGYATGGFVIVTDLPNCPKSGHACFCHGPEATNNVAEYEAALLCLRTIYASGYRGPVELRGDSKLVVEQFAGRWACNKEHLQSRLKKLRKAAAIFESLTLKWVPREENEDADIQSRMAYTDTTGRPFPERTKYRK